MADYIEPIEKLAGMFRRLGGVGKKTAVRHAFDVLDMTDEQVMEFSEALLSLKRDVHFCKCCQNISTDEYCPICLSDKRDASLLCVVEDCRAVSAIENLHEFTGKYHVLHGALSPMKGIGPDKLRIQELMSRLQDGTVEEVILATNPTVEGEATAMYLYRMITSLGIKVTRIANGVPVGGDLEYADSVTLTRALQGRYSLDG